jgi:hypothetical protein
MHVWRFLSILALGHLDGVDGWGGHSSLYKHEYLLPVAGVAQGSARLTQDHFTIRERFAGIGCVCGRTWLL